MYTLYYLPHTCSMATHTVLNILKQPVELVRKDRAADFLNTNPANVVPALQNGDTVVTEGAAILLYLLDKHDNNLLPKSGRAREVAVENIMLANASMHPAYGRLFFAAANIEDDKAKAAFFDAATNAINKLWQVVEGKLAGRKFLGGDTISAADILLSVYSRWGEYFPVDIRIGANTQAMIERVLSSPEFKLALERETEDQ